MKDDEENFISIISRQKNPPSIIVEEYACNIFPRERTPPKVEDEFFEKYGLENFVHLRIYIYLETWSSFGRNSYRPIYTSRYQKLSFLSRSNVIRDVDSRREGRATRSMVITEVIHSATETMPQNLRFALRTSRIRQDIPFFFFFWSSAYHSILGWRAS